MAKAARSRKAMLLGCLPEEIVVWEILVRLPPNSLLRCRAVCRRWLRVTSTRQFLLAHHSHQPSLPIFSGADYRSIAHHQHILAFDHQAVDELQLHSVAKLAERFHLEASCDGLLVLSDCGGTCFYVSNPTTRQTAHLGKSVDVEILGMYPYHPTGDYRLLLHRSSHEECAGATLLPQGQIGCYVFALGSDQPPRYIGIGWHESMSPCFKAPALVRDNLHWYPVNYHSEDDSMEDRIEIKHIIVFDTIAESFRQMRSPIVPVNSSYCRKNGTVPSDSCILEMDGMLCICAHNTTTEIADIWMLQHYKSEVWDLKYQIKLPVAEIREQFEDCHHHWYVNVVPVDGDVLSLVSFGRWVLRIDSGGKLVAYFRRRDGGLSKSEFRLKQTLVPHTFFSDQESYDWSPFR